MSRGDQRERDRAKNQAKQQQKIKATGKSGDPLTRNLNDAAALEAKRAAKAAAEAKAGDNMNDTASTPVVRKKVPAKKKETVDDLLSAGLAGTKKTRAK